jgi:hypothetical protein
MFDSKEGEVLGTKQFKVYQIPKHQFKFWILASGFGSTSVFGLK